MKSTGRRNTQEEFAKGWRVRKTKFEEFETVRIPEKGITGTIIDVRVCSDGRTYYLVENDEWGDVDDPDAWNAGYAIFDCTAEQLAHIDEPTNE